MKPHNEPEGSIIILKNVKYGQKYISCIVGRLPD